jgi:hypothetical protein
MRKYEKSVSSYVCRRTCMNYYNASQGRPKARKLGLQNELHGAELLRS